MSIAAVFTRLRERGELALIPYLTAGFPTRDAFEAALRDVSEHGADLIEIGIPFSDPVADGPTIQYSSQVALSGGASLQAVFESLRRVRAAQPLIFMSYLNPLLAYGQRRLLAEMAEVGARGLIIPDLPVEESDEWLAAARAAGVNLIYLAAPTSPDARLRAIAARSDAFVYAVSVAGVTGARSALSDRLPTYLKRLRTATDRPIAVGFGISTPEHVRALRGLADGVVVGSRLVDALRNSENLPTLLASFKQAARS